MKILLSAVFLCIQTTIVFASPKATTQQFWLTSSQTARRALCTTALQKKMRTEYVRKFASLENVKVQAAGNKATVQAVAKRGWFSILVKAELVKVKGWKVSNYFYKVGKSWLDMDKVMSKTHNMRVKSGPNGWIIHNTKIIYSQTLRGKFRIRIGKDKRSPKGSFSVTVILKPDMAVSLKKYSWKGLKRLATSSGSQQVNFQFRNPSSFPFKTDVELVFKKDNANLKGVRCWTMPQLKENSTHTFKAKKGGVIKTFSRLLYKGTITTGKIKKAIQDKQVKIGHQVLYYQRIPKEVKKMKKPRRHVMITGLLHNTTKASLGELKFFVDGYKATYPTIKTHRVGKNIAFTVMTSDFFYGPGPFRTYEFKTFKLCHTPKQYNPTHHFVFRYKNLVIP